MDYVRGVPNAAPRTMRNHKTAVCEFFNWMLDRRHIVANPAAGYDPEIVAHEVVQLIAGVRADDEMADFSPEFVHPQTKEVVIPAAVAKTEAREVIDGLEGNFWTWWKEYAPKKGLLRPKNHGPRCDRIRLLATIDDQQEADRLAQLPVVVLRFQQTRESPTGAPRADPAISVLLERTTIETTPTSALSARCP